MGEEQVYITDENNVVLRSAPRSEMRKKNLWHRAIHILVFNDQRELFVHQRTFEKDLHPGYYDTKLSGVVAQESYIETAKRELKEELGIKDVPLHQILSLKTQSSENKAHVKVFTCRHNGPFTLQPEEIIQEHQFTPEGLLSFEKYYKEFRK